MNASKRRHLIFFVSLCAGMGDSVTGLALAFAPEKTLVWMHVPAVQDSVFLRFVGCFVFVVGGSYLVGLFFRVTDPQCKRLQTVWELTALFRAVAGGFVAVQVAKHVLAWPWLSVPLVDGFWCLLQVLLLYRGIFEEVEA